MTEEELERAKAEFFTTIEAAIEFTSGEEKTASEEALQRLRLLKDTYVFEEAIMLSVERRKKQAH
jgi:hypothetical protein